MTSEITESSAVESPALEMRGVSKSFDATQALDNVSLCLYPGEIHALLGENGAGKSTLIKIMTGIHQPDQGQILLDGNPIRSTTPDEQKRWYRRDPSGTDDLPRSQCGREYLHQPPGRCSSIGVTMYQDAEAILAQLDVNSTCGSQARGLTLAQQQTVEIAKAISLKVRVLIMDEPTASLSAHEVARLFVSISDSARQGVAMLFISHRMEEVFAIADRITVIRDGKLISTAPARVHARISHPRYGRAQNQKLLSPRSCPTWRCVAVGAKLEPRRRFQ